MRQFRPAEVRLAFLIRTAETALADPDDPVRRDSHTRACAAIAAILAGHAPGPLQTERLLRLQSAAVVAALARHHDALARRAVFAQALTGPDRIAAAARAGAGAYLAQLFDLARRDAAFFESRSLVYTIRGALRAQIHDAVPVLLEQLAHQDASGLVHAHTVTDILEIIDRCPPETAPALAAYLSRAWFLDDPGYLGDVVLLASTPEGQPPFRLKAVSCLLLAGADFTRAERPRRPELTRFLAATASAHGRLWLRAATGGLEAALARPADAGFPGVSDIPAAPALPIDRTVPSISRQKDSQTALAETQP